MADTPIGRRERNNERTRTAIRRAALELTLDHGFERATIAEIAERADVAPRTVHTWFPSKEDIVLGGVGEYVDRLRRELEEGGGDVVDRIKRWLRHEGERYAEEDELGLLVIKAFAKDPHLRGLERRWLGEMEEQIAAAVARDAGLPADHLAVQAFSGAAIGILLGLRNATVRDVALEVEALELAMQTLRGALTALRPRPDAHVGPSRSR